MPLALILQQLVDRPMNDSRKIRSIIQSHVYDQRCVVDGAEIQDQKANGGDWTWQQTHRALVPLMRADNWRNSFYILGEYVLLTLIMSGCVFAYNAWHADAMSLSLFAPLAVLGIMAVAMSQHRLSGLGHEASHYSLFKNRFANELISDLFLMFPVVALTHQFRASHMRHHQFVNDPLKDPDVVRLNKPVPEHWPIKKGRFWVRYVLLCLWAPTLLHYIYGQAKNANFSVSGQGKPLRNVYSIRTGLILRGLYWVALAIAVQMLHAWPIFLLFWVVPLLTFYPFFMQLREIAHHSNAPDDGDLTNSRIFRVHPLLKAAVFPYGQDFHVTHHLFSMLPHYRMEQAHAILLRHLPYREKVVICRGYFFRTFGTQGPSVLDVLSQHSVHGPVGAVGDAVAI